VAAVAIAVLVLGSPAPAAAASPPSAQRVIAIATSQLGKPWRFGADGPRAFDCSGLVLYAFERAGLAGRLGGGHSATGMWRWFVARGKASRADPHPGDLVIYGRGSHVGIYIGRGRVVSTLANGVRITGVYALHSGFTTFLHTRLAVGASRPTIATARANASAKARTTAGTASRSTRATGTPSRVVTASLRLRTGASLASRVLGMLAPGSRVAIVGAARSGGRTWYHVRAGGHVGWVAAAYTRAP
jgi:hypothetical protein